MHNHFVAQSLCFDSQLGLPAAKQPERQVALAAVRSIPQDRFHLVELVPRAGPIAGRLQDRGLDLLPDAREPGARC
jgi:hypothetical protein